MKASRLFYAKPALDHTTVIRPFDIDCHKLNGNEEPKRAPAGNLSSRVRTLLFR